MFGGFVVAVVVVVVVNNRRVMSALSYLVKLTIVRYFDFLFVCSCAIYN